MSITLLKPLLILCLFLSPPRINHLCVLLAGERLEKALELMGDVEVITNAALGGVNDDVEDIIDNNDDNNIDKLKDYDEQSRD